MTSEEAKRILEFDLDHTYNDESKEAFEMAIRYMEAWQKVLDDLEDCEDAGHWIDISQVFEIINRYLKEAEE